MRNTARSCATLAFAAALTFVRAASAQPPFPAPAPAPQQPAAPAPAAQTPAAPTAPAAQPAAQSTASPNAAMYSAVPDDSRRRFTWDLNLDGAAGYAFVGEGEITGFGRIRGGLLYIDESSVSAPLLVSVGLTYELSDRSPATFGIQAEVLPLTAGAWLQLGALLDAAEVRPGFMVSGGLSIFGVEAQLRGDDEHGSFWALYGKIRVPVRIIVKAFEKK